MLLYFYLSINYYTEVCTEGVSYNRCGRQELLMAESSGDTTKNFLGAGLLIEPDLVRHVY